MAQRETVTIEFAPSRRSQDQESFERRAERTLPTFAWEVPPQTGLRAQSTGDIMHDTANSSYRSTLDDDDDSKTLQINVAVTEFHAPPPLEQEDIEQDSSLYYTIAPGEDEAAAADVHTNWDAQSSFERPRMVPYDHRETRLVVKEDIDFFMALVSSQEPPPATEETQHFIQEEEAARRKSEKVLEREASGRKDEELVTTKMDLDFWNSLMKA